MVEKLFSIRMRASKGDTHISGAERIVREEDIHATLVELLSRAKKHDRGEPDSINITIDSLAGRKLLRLPPLPVCSLEVGDVSQGRGMAVSELIRAGVSETAATSAMASITEGRSLRGAIILNHITGARLAPEMVKGVRARAVDYDESFLPAINRKLELSGLSRSRLKDALALATKVAGAPGAVAELCISDDPGYVTGYVASAAFGYKRINPLKPVGDFAGGRVFFVDTDNFNLDTYINYLRETPVLVAGDFEIL